MFGYGPCEGASPEGLLDSWRGHGVRSILGLRLASFRVMPCLARRRSAVPGREGGQQMLAGDRLAPVL